MSAPTVIVAARVRVGPNQNRRGAEMNRHALQRSCAACGAVVAVVAAGLWTVPAVETVTALPRIEFHQIQLQSATASATLGSTSPGTDRLDLHDIDPARHDSTPAAAVAESDDPFGAGLATALDIVGRAVVDVAGLLIAPLWYLAFPITYQMASNYLNTIDSSYYNYPDLTGLVGLLRLVRVIGIWMEFPLRASSYLFPTPIADHPSLAAATPGGSRTVGPVVPPEVHAAEWAGDQDQVQEPDRVPTVSPRTHHPRRGQGPATHRAAEAASASASAVTIRDGVSSEGRTRASSTRASSTRRSLSAQASPAPSIARTEGGSGIAGSQSGAATGSP